MGLFWIPILSFLLLISLSISDTNVDDTFIVQVQNNLLPSQFSDAEEWYSSILHNLTSDDPVETQRARHKNLIHVYQSVFHGFSATLTKQQTRILHTRPEVLHLFPDRVRQIQTTRTPHFLGLTPGVSNEQLLSLSQYGSNVVIGVLDSGVWPESPSFRDDGLGPIPSHWKGECTEGERFSKTNCNRKLIGARFFNGRHDVGSGLSYTDEIKSARYFKSARDSIGHGTHTATTAAGVFVRNASFLQYYANGDAVGMAPKARIAVYKVCWGKEGCYDSDILAGLEKAVEDKVDIISLSLGISLSLPYHEDPIAIASFAAAELGVFVSAGAGNDGPDQFSVRNAAPWMTTVGAGTIDRAFPADVILGDGQIVRGSSLYRGDPLPEKRLFPLVYGKDASANGSAGAGSEACLRGSLNPELVRGKLVVCDLGDTESGLVVKEAGGIGVVASKLKGMGEGLEGEPFLYPGVSITESGTKVVRDYLIRSSSDHQNHPKATLVFYGTKVGVKPAPVVAAFSSRGPNFQSNYLLKPDVIAPGVNILAAWPDEFPPTASMEDKRKVGFNILSGTSMACPHVSGIAALLKGAHPDWSPAMIRSALMTTAYTHDSEGKPLLDEYDYSEATIWATGAGHVDPRKAVEPGLVYDLSTQDYVKFLCASNYTGKNIQVVTGRPVDCRSIRSKPWDFNYPAIVMAFDVSSKPLSSKLEVVITRIVTHVSELGKSSNYSVSITSPKNTTLTVDPPTMSFKSKGEKQKYVVKITAEYVSVSAAAEHRHEEVGNLVWFDGEHKVTSPVVVVWLHHTN